MTVINLKITKDGKLIGDVWKPKDKEYQRNTDLTDLFFLYFHHECDIEDGVKLLDIFKLIQNLDAYPLLSQIFTSSPCWLKELVEEGIREDVSPETDIVKISVGWRCSTNDDYYNEGESIIESYVDVYGLTADENDRYALDFSPMSDLRNCNVILNKKFEIFDERKEALDGRQKYLDSLPNDERSKESFYPLIMSSRKNFTLFDILHGMFWEFSFHGGPSDRNDKRDRLMEQVKNVESGEARLMPLEEIKNRFKDKQGDSE